MLWGTIEAKMALAWLEIHYEKIMWRNGSGQLHLATKDVKEVKQTNP